MFFIPFFGAAVTGKHYNVAGWKKAVVSLAGPVPGIMLGVLLGAWGLVNHKPEVVNVATLALAVNGFNLLPLMPLDGGHVMHALLFSRHYVLDVAFRVAAALLLLLLGIVAGGGLMYIALLMLAGAPLAFRLAKTAYDLRTEGASGASPDGYTIPPELAQRIADRLTTGAKKPQGVKILAQHTLTVFEQLNARPPGVLGTLGLVGVHGGTFAAMLIAVVTFMLMGSDVFRAAFEEGTTMPDHTAPAAVEVAWRGEKFEDRAAEHRTVVATFDKAKTARTAADGVKPALPPTAELLIFGDSVIVMLPAGEAAAHEATVKALEAQTKDVFVETKEQLSSLRLTGVVNSEEEAKALVEELSEAFLWTGDESLLVMPWQVGNGVTPADYARYRMARRTVHEIQQAALKAYKDPALQDLMTRSGAARRRGNIEEAKALAKEREATLIKTERSKVEALRKDVPRLDPEVIDAMLAVPATQPWAFSGKVPLAVKERLGVAGPAWVQNAARGGYVRNNKLFVDIRLTLPDVGHALPEVLRWLAERRMLGIRYQFFEPDSFGAWSGAEEE
jgi:hypothetical protein